MDNELLFDLVF